MSDGVRQRFVEAATLASQRALFDIPEDVAYFNCAYMSPLARRVVAAGEVGMHRKVRPWMLEPSDFFPEVELARQRFAELIKGDPEGVAIVPSASYGIAVAAANLPVTSGDRILILAEQFPSNVYAWRERARQSEAQLLVVARPSDEDWTRAVLEALQPGVAVAALPQCHWTDGGWLDLEAIAAKCREIGACLALDLTQSAGAAPFHAERVQPDFVACATYKWLMGPYSVGFVYAAPRWRDGQPLEHNWIGRAGSQDFAGLVDYRDDFQPGARRYDVGERSNFALIPMVNEAMAMLLDWGVERIAATLSVRTTSIAEKASEFGFTTLAADRRAPHFLGLRLPGKGSTAGALPVNFAEGLAKAGVFVSVRGNSIRVTPHVYNTSFDEDRLLHALCEAI